MLIYKQQLPNNTGIEMLKLPFDSVEEAKENILHLELQHETPCIWYNVKREQQKEFMIVTIGTGHDWGDTLKREEYIGSLVVEKGLFEKSINITSYFCKIT